MSNPNKTALKSYFFWRLSALTFASELATGGCECYSRDASHGDPAFRSAAPLAVFFFLVRGSRGGSVLPQPVLHSGFDLGQLFRLGFEVAGMSPLEFCFRRAA